MDAAPGLHLTQSQSLPTSNSQRRKLKKQPPPSSRTHSSSLSFEGRLEAQSLQSKRSSTSLRRAPSAPPARTPTSHASSTSSPRLPPSTANRSNPSPVLPSDGFGVAAPSSSSSYAVQRNSDPHLANRHGPLTLQSPEDFVGAPFDGASILNRIDAIKSPVHHQTHFPTRPAPPPPTRAAGPDPRAMGPPLRQSASFGSDPVVSEKAPASKAADSQLPAVKRYSDEAKDAKMPGVLRKKSGFSGFMSGLVGTPKKPMISAPENPVHVTHVGYDSATGQFTVRPCPAPVASPRVVLTGR